MARYITIPGPVTLLDPSTDEPIKHQDGGVREVSFAELARVLVLDQRLQEKHDTFAINDLRRKLSLAAVGDVVEISDAEHESLSTIVKSRPPVSAHMFVSGEEHFRAIVDAPSKRPAVAAQEEPDYRPAKELESPVSHG